MANLGVPWVIVGSTSQALQGLPLVPHDIDLETTSAAIVQVEKALAEFVVEPVAEKESAQFRSLFGRLQIEGLQVELMADVAIRADDGSWMPVPTLDEHFPTVELVGFECNPLSGTRRLK